MSDSTTTENTADPAGQVEAENTDGNQTETPEWAAKELERARKEAAKYRDRARTSAEETEAKLRDEFATREAELAKQIETLTAQVTASEAKANHSERAKTKLHLALEHGIPAEKIDTFTKRLMGDTADELAEDAKSLAEMLAPKVQEDHSQGVGGVPLNSPTILSALEGVVSRRR